MEKTLQFSDLLRLIEERSTAFQAVVAAAPSLDAIVPTCPEWTLFDLAEHIGTGRFAWAATVAAGPDATTKSSTDAVAPVDRAELSAWLADSTRALVDALRDAGPDRGCWVWWEQSQSPATCGAVARHQLQQMAVHTYDAQITVGTPQPLPEEIALDGVEEFLFTCCATTAAWPHEPAVVDYHATEGRSWRVRLSADGAQVGPLTAEAADATATGTASQLVEFFYGRISPDAVKLDGDPRVFDKLFAWDPDA
ncbi:maleylpyruvate isomerase family mycothiol-dependent enzyme [Catenuloplanes sp. NPDC051500]|uniref:maleylpyruvate isomerase family mycothiol-dependent enzyme n=1 Tax=Catenuloplanes sp. NPDC051500 TaxID=3363959 RepID=UPI0037A9A420